MDRSARSRPPGGLPAATPSAHTSPDEAREAEARLDGAPLSRVEQQQRTRHALVLAARAVFTRDGYHGATLAQIAREAGFSKGAVYSNFANKAELFLAVMELNLSAYRGGAWDPFAEPVDEDRSSAGDPDDPLDDESSARSTSEEMRGWEEAALRGFGLATLEFLAVAMRDPDLSRQVTQHVEQMLSSYTSVAERARPDGEVLDVADVSALLAALDEGISLLGLLGITRVDAPLLRTGLRRLVDPARAAEDPEPPANRDGRPAFVHPDLRERLFADEPHRGPSDGDRG